MKKYSAIIVTFFPNIEKLINMIELLVSEKVHVVVVNNTPLNDLKLEIRCNNKNFNIINNNRNLGIAKAQNIAIKFLLEKSIYATFFFDQDSQLDNQLLTNLKKGLSPMINIVAPVILDKNTSREIPSLRVNKIGLSYKKFCIKNTEIQKTELVISSGLLIKMDMFEKIGFFDEEMFIDYVDFEWCFRSLYFGEKIYVVPNAILKHKIGKGVITFFFLKTNSHNPMRTYYKIRNPLILLKRKHVPFLWAIKEILLSIKCLIIQIIVDKQRLLHARKGISGLKDGFIVNFQNKKSK